MPDTTGTNLNLDRLAARCAQTIIATARQGKEKPKEVENTATKALGVLQENGIYACALFLGSRSATESPRALMVLDNLLDLMANMGFPEWQERKPASATQSEAVLSYISETIAADLSRLLLAKETGEQMLIYTRYGAKAWANEDG